MQAVVLAGGLGTRLREVVKDIPKSMAPIDGRPFLEYQLKHLRNKGFREILLLVGYLSGTIVDHFGDGSRFGLNISYSMEKEPLGTAGALRNAVTLLDTSFLLLNGDTFLDLDYNELISVHRDKKALVTIALVPVADSSRYGSVQVDEDGNIKAFSEKTAGGAGLINGGVYIIEKSILETIVHGVTVSLEKEVIPSIIREHKPVAGMVTQGYFVDIGTPDGYDLARRYFVGGPDVRQE